MDEGEPMKCEWVRENITLHVYGELADDARHELEQHVERCADCAAEMKVEKQFHPLLCRRRACCRLRACGCRKRWRRPSKAASGIVWLSIPRTGCGRCASRRRW